MEGPLADRHGGTIASPPSKPRRCSRKCDAGKRKRSSPTGRTTTTVATEPTLFRMLLSNDIIDPSRDRLMADRAELLQGTLDLLILKSLALGPLHGWAISKRLRQISADALDVGQGSLYPALYRMEDRGWVTSEAGTTPNGR